jgi:hypothetical protein
MVLYLLHDRLWRSQGQTQFQHHQITIGFNTCGIHLIGGSGQVVALGRSSLFVCTRDNPVSRKDRRNAVSRVRGLLMLVLACVAFWRGYKIHTGGMVFTAYGLGVLALGLAVWHLTRKPAPPRVR